MFTMKKGSRVNCLAQAGFAAFDEEAQLIYVIPFAKTEHLSQQTLLPVDDK